MTARSTLAGARICVATSFQFPGTTGSPVLTMQTTAQLRHLAADVYVVRYRGWRGLRIRHQVWEGIDVYALPLVWVLPKLLHLALTRRPTVVHAHGFLGAKLGATMCLLGRCRLVMEFHSAGLDLSRHEALSGIRGAGHRVAHALVARSLAYVITYSAVQARTAVEAGWVDDDHVAVIYPPVDEPFFVDAVRPLPSAEPIVGYAGNFRFYQGVQLLLEAMRTVWAERPDAQVELWGAEPAEADELGDQVDDPRIHLKGRVALEEMPAILQGLDILVIPRPDIEANSTTGRKLGEYLASGRPIVATDVADHRLLLDADAAGYVVAADADGVAQGILAVLADPAEAVARAERGLELARARFSLEAATDARVDLLARA